MSDHVKVYRKSTGERLQNTVPRSHLRFNTDLAVVPTQRTDADREALAAEPKKSRKTAARTRRPRAPKPSTTPVEQTQTTTDDPTSGSEQEKE